MSFEHLADPARPAWTGVLPGRPAPYVLRRGDGEHAKLFADTFTVLLSGDETGGEFGIFTATCPAGDIIPTHSHAGTNETFYVVEGSVRLFLEQEDGQRVSHLLGEGDFGFVPAGLRHAYRVEAPTRMLGVSSGGFERFFQEMGTPADTIDPGTPPFVPAPDRMRAAAQRHEMRFEPDFRWPEE